MVYGGDGQLKCQTGPEELLSGMSGEEVDSFDKAFLTFGIRSWKWCQTGRIACFSDAQENVYLWNAVIHKLMGQITLQLDALKLQNPVRILKLLHLITVRLFFVNMLCEMLIEIALNVSFKGKLFTF